MQEKKQYRCCIFDLDGTLIDSIHALSRTVNLMLERYGLGPIDDAHIKVFVGDGYQKLVERALLDCGDQNLIHLEDALSVYNELFKENCLYRIAAYDGIKELLEYLKSKGIKIAVLSNKGHERTVENIEAVFGKDYFDLISGEKEGVNRKPDPAGALLTARELGIDPSCCLYLGDTNTDMKTGIAAGMDTIGVTWGFRTREELESYHPMLVVDEPGEVVKLI